MVRHECVALLEFCWLALLEHRLEGFSATARFAGSGFVLGVSYLLQSSCCRLVLLAVLACLRSVGVTVCFVVTNISVKTAIKGMFAKFVIA